MGGSPRRPQRWGLGFTTVTGLLGFLVAMAFVQERIRERELPEQAAHLRALVEQRRATVAELAAEVSSGAQELAAAQERAAEGSTEVRRLVGRLETLRASAGVRAVSGPGLVVEVGDSTRQPTTPEEEIDLRVQDVDLQVLVNTLWRGGAEAVAINGQRVVATSAIRSAAGAIQVNYRAIPGPYRITAIGNPEGLAAGLERSGALAQFEVWRQVYGLAFAVEETSEATVPGIDTGQELRWARPAGKT